MTLNLLLADDHALFRKAIKKLLSGTYQIFEAADGIETLNVLRSENISIVLLDIRMPHMDGYDTIKVMRKEFPNVKVLMFTTFNDPALVISFVKMGAQGYILKNDENLESAIQDVMMGRFYYSQELRRAICQAQEGLSRPRPIQLSKTEQRLMPLLAQGKNTEEISKELQLTRNTVESYRRELLNKFDVKNSIELIDYAHRIGLL